MGGMKATKNTKSEKAAPARKPKLDLDTVYQRVLNILVRTQPRDLTYSKLSRLTGVPRPTLYYYFGSSVESLVQEALRYGMKIFLQIYAVGEDAAISDWSQLQKTRMVRSLQLIRQYPWGPGLYFRYRNDQGKVGQTIRDVEHQYLLELAGLWKKVTGKAPDPSVLKLSGALKLGLFFAVSSEGGLKIPENDSELERWSDELSRVMTEAMKVKLS